MHRRVIVLSCAFILLLVAVVERVREAAAQKDNAGLTAGKKSDSGAISLQEDEAYRRRELFDRRSDRFGRRVLPGDCMWIAPEWDYERFASQQATFFPDLGDAYDLVGPASQTQNCVSYTVGESFTLWGGADFRPYDTDSWGTDTTRVTEFYQRRGYLQQDDLDTRFKEGVQKVVVYLRKTSRGTECKHAAVQQPNGNWRSKLGKEYVIEHVNPEALCDQRSLNYCNVGMVFWKANPAFKKSDPAAP